ncbi:hypothetical protein DL766_002637 [Monosporascus sp. MC13-8B]|uniref:Glutathione S-transferase n=1 Tax=Monosporascus cannonballus TaxID=155416 RepID=A0ABY0HBR0_9PEZI|nr:hypothetical protein DL762_003053 [Monosporascus cannonballus]RYP35190.1 hypothetical protein DL766_002637 [Monosporascus sp. MC13-8B]
MKPITLYSHHLGPNPWKVALVLEELNIPYKTKFVDIKAVKQEPYILLNPNGRLPTIEDPNTGLTLWESGAIVEYLIERYDNDHKISYAEAPETYLAKQWLFFQVSGQAPYYGQAAWFMRYHPEKLPSAIKRYVDEMHRVTGVLEKGLEKGDWLVGDKYTYADLSFFAWQRWVPRFAGEDIYEKFPKVGAWIKRMESRPAVRKVMEDQDAAIAEMEGKS